MAGPQLCVYLKYGLVTASIGGTAEIDLFNICVMLSIVMADLVKNLYPSHLVMSPVEEVT